MRSGNAAAHEGLGLQGNEIGVHEGPTAGARPLGDRQQCRHDHRRGMAHAGTEVVVVVERMGGRAVDQRRDRGRLATAGDERCFPRELPAESACDGKRAGVGAPGVEAGDGVGDRLACQAPGVVRDRRRSGAPGSDGFDNSTHCNLVVFSLEAANGYTPEPGARSACGFRRDHPRPRAAAAIAGPCRRR